MRKMDSLDVFIISVLVIVLGVGCIIGFIASGAVKIQFDAFCVYNSRILSTETMIWKDGTGVDVLILRQ